MDKQSKIFTIICLIGMLTGCTGTIYQPLGATGGYTDTRLDANTVRVTYYGNPATSQASVENFMLYRCAQVTIKYGYDYFILVTSGVTAQTNTYTSPGILTMYNTNKSTSTGVYMPGQTINYTRDTSSAIIKMYKGNKPASAANAYAARDIIKYLGPSIPR